jgi:hypothetical protein
MPHFTALAATVALSSPALMTVNAIQKRAIADGAEALLGDAELLSAPVAGSCYGSGGNDECGSLVNVHGVVIDRQTRSSDNFRWCALLHSLLASCPPYTADRELFVLRLRFVRCHRAGHWAGGVGETVLLELGQVGSAFDTIKVYIDCYRGAAAVCTGLLPGAV